MFQSQRAAKFMFQVREGQTKVLPSVFKSHLVHDKALKPPTVSIKPTKNQAPENEYRFYGPFYSSRDSLGGGRGRQRVNGLFKAFTALIVVLLEVKNHILLCILKHKSLF
jgi:hypothetical protein